MNIVSKSWRFLYLITFFFCLPITISAASKPSLTSGNWGELACIWGCSFNSCKNIEILRRCSQNCDKSYLKQCMNVAQSAFGDLLPQALSPLLTKAPKKSQVQKSPSQSTKKDDNGDKDDA